MPNRADQEDLGVERRRLHAGIYLANYDTYADPAFILDVAQCAGRTGWDGIFLYDHVVLESYATIDSWTTLAAVAVSVPELTVGVLLAIPARRHIGVLAQQAATLHKLAGLRLVVGLGAGEDQDFEAFGASMDLRTRAAHVQLALDLLPQLWAGMPVSGTYGAAARPGDPPAASCELDRVRTGPPMARAPRIWLGGGHRNSSAMRRASQAEGIFPIRVPWDPERPLAPDQYSQLVAEAKRHRGSKPLETATTGMSAPGAMHSVAGAFEELDWWLELMTPEVRSPSDVLQRVGAGP